MPNICLYGEMVDELREARNGSRQQTLHFGAAHSYNVRVMFQPLPAKVTLPPDDPTWVIRRAGWQALRRVCHESGFNKPLTVVTAAAGFGKTTLVASWLHAPAPDGCPHQAVWLALDEADNDPSRFFPYLISAIATQFAGFGTGSMQALADAALASATVPPQNLLEQLVASFVSDLLAIDSPFLLVLDDFHRIKNPALVTFVSTLVDNLSSRQHLILIGRDNPLLPIAHMMGQGKLNMLGELRLTEREASLLLENLLPGQLESEQKQSLIERTDGWAVGLQLAALRLQGLPETARAPFLETFAGSDQLVSDYLIDEVLLDLPRDIRLFLRQTAFLERFNIPLCVAVTGLAEAGQLISQISSSNLFLIALDYKQEWFRYHQLWADLLWHRARQQLSDAEQGTLVLRAARWFAENGQFDEAVQYALLAGDCSHDYTFAVQLIVENAIAIFTSGRVQTLAAWLDGVPKAVVEGHPYLSFVQAFVLFDRRQFIKGEVALERAEALVVQLPASQRRNILGEIATTRAVRASFGLGTEQIIENAERAIELLDPANAWALASVNQSLAVAHWMEGDLLAAEAAFDNSWLLAERSGNLYILGATLGFQSILYLMLGNAEGTERAAQRLKRLNDNNPTLPRFFAANGFSALAYRHVATLELEKARQYGEQALALVQTALNIDSVSLPLNALALWAMTVRDWAKYAEYYQAGLAAAERFQTVWVRYFFEAVHLTALVEQGKLEAAVAHLETLGVVTFRPEESRLNAAQAGWEFEIAGRRVRLHWHRRQSDQAAVASLAEEIVGLVDGHDLREQPYFRWRYLVLGAMAWQAAGQPHGARELLYHALALAAPAEWRNMFILEGEQMRSLLQTERDSMVQRGIPAAFLDDLLTRFPDQTYLELPDPLTERESEVLALIVAGFSNKQIADRLTITYGTTKRHVNNIYSKLGVNSRAQAILKGQEIGER